MAESTQHKLDRIRPPRVQITYDVEIGGAIQKKELPFVVGILADLSGQRDQALPPLKERKFVEIDRDNFNQVLASIQPRVFTSVENHLKPGGGAAPVDLKFNTLEDFTPAQIVLQVAELRKLFEARQKLNDLLAKLDGNDTLESMLQEIAAKPEQLKQLKSSNPTEGESAHA